MRNDIVVVTTFTISPAVQGGQARILGLYRALAAGGLRIEVVAMAPRTDRARTQTLAPGLRETRVPISPRHEQAEHQRWRQAGIPVNDISVTLDHELTPAFGDAIARASAGAAAVVVSHPYGLPAVRAACDAPVVYEAHNVEFDLKAEMLSATAPDLVEATRDVEHDACRRAALVMACSEHDAARLSELYDVARDHIVLVPNGVDPQEHPFTDAATRARRKAQLGLGECFTSLFVGSWHEPNLDAVRTIFAAARADADVHHIVCGGAGEAFRDHREVPRNVDLCGIVSPGFLRAALGVADAAVNPMRFGSGTNLKTLTYALAGVPIVSSATGVRGLGFTPGRHYLDAGPAALADGLRALRAEDEAVTAGRVDAARAHVGARFAWSQIAERLTAAPAWQALLHEVAA